MLTKNMLPELRISVNTSVYNKTSDHEALSANYKDVTVDLQIAMGYVLKGYAISAGQFGGRRRKKENVVGSHWLLLDVDNTKLKLDEHGHQVFKADGRKDTEYDPQLTLEQAVAHPFVKMHCAAIYTSFSHKPEWHKFRLAFILPEYETDVAVYEAMVRQLMSQLPHDPACKDASRVFFGNSNAEIPLFNPHVTLPPEWREQAQAAVILERAKREQNQVIADRKRARHQIRIEAGEISQQDTDALALSALYACPPRSPGSNNYYDCLRILMALVSHFGESEAERIAEAWSPSIKGTKWNVGKKIRSLKRGGTNVGTLFYIAKQNGWRFPTVDRHAWAEPKCQGTENPTPRDEWEWNHGLPNLIRRQLAKIQNIFKGFGKQPEPDVPPSTAPLEVLKYAHGELPNQEQYNALGSPIIQFSEGERLQALREAVDKGWHDILDSSATGTGKSHDVGLASAESFEVDRLWGFSPTHRNPTTATFEANYADMPVRNDGLVVDDSRRTALNNPHVRWPQGDEKPTTEGNCFRTPLFHSLAAKGYQAEAGLTSGENPVCKTCHLRGACTGKDAEATGSGFRRDRRDAFLNTRIRASLDSAPSARDLEAKEDDETGEIVVGGRNAAFLDEAMVQLKPISAVEAELSDFDQMFGEIETKLPEVHESLKPLRLAIRPILAGEVAPTKETYHGWNDAAVRDLFRSLEIEVILEIITQLKSIQPNFGEILQEPDGFNKDGVRAPDRKDVSAETSKYIRSHLRQESYRHVLAQLRGLPNNWLVPFLEVLSREKMGALRINNGKLSVVTADPHHADTLQAMTFVVYLDATANREYLALVAGIEQGSILQIEQEPARVENLSLVQLTDFGLLGHDRSKLMKKRLGALKPALRSLHSDISFIEHKVHAEVDDGWWFNHNRGTNEYMNRSAIASFGTPYKNIGQMQDLWLTLERGTRNVAKDSPAFSKFVEWQAQSEMAQSVGRLRATRRPDEQLNYYSCGDFDLGFLARYYPGARITQRPALDITPEAGTEGQQTRWALMQGIRACVEQGKKVTQEVLAKHAHVSQQRIQKIFEEAGCGWQTFKKIQLTLLESLYRTSCNFETLPEELQFIVTGYLPLVAEEPAQDVAFALANTAKAYGWEAFRAVLAASAPETRGKLLGACLSLLPATLLVEIALLIEIEPIAGMFSDSRCST